jgi:phage terminase large subunit
MKNNREFNLTPKQSEAFLYLTNSKTTEILYGGAAGGGKSFLGCLWILQNCIKHPGTRWLIGRARLKTLKETTLKTLYEVIKIVGMTEGVHYSFNQTLGQFTFSNGSEIILKDLFHYPADPNFDQLGSLEITGAFIDEANQITKKAKDIVTSRIRYKLDENNLIPKVLMTCNPARNWVYADYYKAHRDGTILPYRAFVGATSSDNPHLSKHYIDNLEKLDDVDRQRLKEGNWEYSEEDLLFNQDDILDMFVFKENFNKDLKLGERYMTVDVARKGKDKTVIMIWEGLECIYFEEESVSNLAILSDKINELEREWNVDDTIVDEDGVGGGVVDMARTKGFVGGSKALNGENYQNLRTQCYMHFSTQIKNIKINKLPPEQKEKLIQELQQYKRKNIDNDGKIQISSKDDIKARIGRSPDYADTIMMRMYFLINNNQTLEHFFTINY